MPSEESNPVISVLMSAYNSEAHIKGAIDSILSQTFISIELIIADDGSGDKTRTIIDSFAKHRKVIICHNDSNQGKVATVNRLFRKAKGDFITVHDADDYSHPKRIEYQIDFLSKNPSVGFCGTNFITITPKGCEHSKLRIDPKEIRNNLSKDSQLHGPTIVFRKQLLNEGYIYRDFFEGYGEDYDLCLRLIEKAEAANLREHLYYYRITKNSLSRTLTPQKLFMHDIARYLKSQREGNNQDYLQKGLVDQVNEKMDSFLMEFREDPSKVYRMQAELDSYYNFYFKAVSAALKAIVVNPSLFENYRLLQHCLRKLILRF